MKDNNSPRPGSCFFRTPTAGGYWFPEGMAIEDCPIPEAQAKSVLRKAVLHPKRAQLISVLDPGSRTIRAQIRMRPGPGGTIQLHPEDAGTPLAASLGVALERIGCLHKLSIASEPFTAETPLPFPVDLGKKGGRR